MFRLRPITPSGLVPAVVETRENRRPICLLDFDRAYVRLFVGASATRIRRSGTEGHVTGMVMLNGCAASTRDRTIRPGCWPAPSRLVGEHRFGEIKTGNCEARARFVHLWHQTGSTWQLARVVSYHHRSR
jgi:hypothetical protein